MMRLRTLARDHSAQVVNGTALGVAASADKDPLRVNLCGNRPNNTSHFDTIRHAPAAAFC
jgi:hypothetical protein